MLKQIWYRVKCKLYGHPYNIDGTQYELIPIEFKGFYSSTTMTLMIIKCTKCRASIGRV